MIDDLARGIGIIRTGIRERRAWFLLLIVARIRGCSGVAGFDREIHRAEADRSGPAAVADHLEAFIPFGGKLHGELRLGPDGAADIAVFGQGVGFRDQLRGLDFYVGAE